MFSTCQPGGPPRKRNTKPCSLLCTRQGFSGAEVVNMQEAGRYTVNPPLRDTPVLRARLRARTALKGTPPCWAHTGRLTSSSEPQPTSSLVIGRRELDRRRRRERGGCMEARCWRISVSPGHTGLSALQHNPDQIPSVRGNAPRRQGCPGWGGLPANDSDPADAGGAGFPRETPKATGLSPRSRAVPQGRRSPPQPAPAPPPHSCADPAGR